MKLFRLNCGIRLKYLDTEKILVRIRIKKNKY